MTFIGERIWVITEAKDDNGKTRMDYAKEELLKTLEGLSSRTWFNIVTFSASPLMFDKEMQKATKKNKARATEWVLAQLPAGPTNTFDTLKQILCSLSPREQRILEMRYGLDGQQPRTLDEVGRAFNVTRERIRQIENQCLKKLRALADCQKLRDVA